MANFNPTVRASDPGKTPKIYNVDVPDADTEYSQLLSSQTKAFTIKVRGKAKLQLAFIAGNTGSEFITVPGGTNYSEDNLNFSGTLYFRLNEPGLKVEIVEWS